MKFGWQHYWAPTPVRVRKMADAIVSASVFAGTMISLNGSPKFGTVIFIAGFFAKIISNFFRNDFRKFKKN